LPGLPEVATEAKVGLFEIIATRLVELVTNLADLIKLEVRIVIS
jgi:hypothetical protein